MPQKKPQRASRINRPLRNPAIVDAAVSARLPGPVSERFTESPQRDEAHLWPRHEDEIDLPTDRPPPYPGPDPNEPLFVGCITAAQRGVAGALSVELLLGLDRAELGCYVLDPHQTVRLWRLLGIAAALLNGTPFTPTRPSPSLRGREGA